MQNVKFSMKELRTYPAFRKLRLLSGEGGLNRLVDSCGILEYQFLPEMKSRYYYTAFRRNMLIFTTFMYALKDESLIGDAVQKLEALGASGLVINDAFHFRITDSVIRFSNAAKFPIFMIDDSPENSLESLIISLDRIVNMRTKTILQERLVDEILNLPLPREELLKKTFQLYPSIGNHYRIDYYLPVGSISDAQWSELLSIVQAAPPPYKDCCRYRDGFFLFHTLDNSCWTKIAENRDPTIRAIQALFPSCTVGISWIHHKMDGMRTALEECIQAAQLQRGPGINRYANLGIYRILSNAADDYRMREFSNDILKPIFSYDASENGRLAQTLFGLVTCNRNLHKLSGLLGQHENTLRQRLARIATLTGLDFRKIEDYEQLSVAVKIHECIEIHNKEASKFGTHRVFDDRNNSSEEISSPYKINYN